MASFVSKGRWPVPNVIRNLAIAAALLATAPNVGSSLARADDAERARAIAAIVETGWTRDSTSLEKAIAQHKKADKAAPADWRVDYALALVYFQHRRFPDAQKPLASAVKTAPEALAAVEAQLWLETYQKQYDVALAHMRRLAKSLGEAAKGEPALDEPALDEPASGDIVSAIDSPAGARADLDEEHLARLMGELLGYLAGPAKSLAPPDAVEACRVEVSASLPRTLIGAFEEGEQSVDDQFVAASDNLVTAREEDAANLARKKEEELARIAEERDRLTKGNDGLKEEEAKATEELDRELASIDKQIPDLQQRAIEVRTLAAPIERLINEMEFRISRQIANANATRDEILRDAAFREADRLQFFIRQEEARLEPLEIEARNIAAALNQLAARRLQHQQRHQARLAALIKEKQRIDKTLKIIDRRDRELSEDSRGSSARTRGQVAKLSALTTYVKFPLEESKAALLAELRDQKWSHHC